MDATLKALDAFAGGLWVILGGKDKGLDYALLREPLAAKAHAALLIGAAAGKIAAAAARAPCRWCDAETLDGGRRVRATATAGPATPCCWRRPAPASTSSAASSIAARFSRTSCNRLEPEESIMAQRLKTDWILFGTVLAHGVVRRW